ncbi:hypothetical protein MIMGU_mgv1a018140mg, partial [Erythranthe guttata]
KILETRDASPAHFLTKIESFSLFSHYGIDKYETREFEAGDYKWRLIIYPNGDEYENKEYISVYLAVAESSSLPVDWEINAIFTIFIYNQILNKYQFLRVNERRFKETKLKWGFPKFMSKKVLVDQSNGYLIDNNIVLGAEVLVIKRQRVIENVTLLKHAENEHIRDWKIQEFSKLENEVWISQEFTISNVNWKMKLYPSIDSNSKTSELSMKLVCASADTFYTHQKVKAKFYMRLKGKPGIVRSSEKPHKFVRITVSHWFTSSDKTCGERAFLSFATLRDPEKGFLVEDCCTLQVEIYVELVV